MGTELNISGMTCGHCQMAVTNAFRSVPGVENAQVDLQALLAAVTEEGYGAQVR